MESITIINGRVNVTIATAAQAATAALPPPITTTATTIDYMGWFFIFPLSTFLRLALSLLRLLFTVFSFSRMPPAY